MSAPAIRLTTYGTFELPTNKPSNVKEGNTQLTAVVDKVVEAVQAAKRAVGLGGSTSTQVYND